MLLPYPITSYGARHVDLTGGLMDKFENFIIAKVTEYKRHRALANELSGMSQRELNDIGIYNGQADFVARGFAEGGHFQRVTR